MRAQLSKAFFESNDQSPKNILTPDWVPNIDFVLAGRRKKGRRRRRVSSDICIAKGYFGGSS
jgi:hypothetical protein